MTHQPTGPVPDRITLTRDQLAALLAHHADVLAAGYRTEAAVCLPAYRDGLHAAADKAARHANRLTAAEESTVVAELLDSMLTAPGSETAAVAHPSHHRWYVETYDRLAGEWAPGMRFTERDEAVERHKTLTAYHPVGQDGTPAKRRLVRETTTYTVLDALPELTAQTVDQAAILREAISAAEDEARHVYDDIGQKAAAGARLVVDRLRRMADETQPTTEPEHACAHCGKNIRRITGTLTEWWVHIPGGRTLCYPWQPAKSPSATPKLAAGAQQEANHD